tara:strand:- start:157 stop:330 length:174 start_codon:yes stop_codon:yes gene_type:complete
MAEYCCVRAEHLVFYQLLVKGVIQVGYRDPGKDANYKQYGELLQYVGQSAGVVQGSS